MSSKMRDAINQELNIGDTVLFKLATGSELLKGEITNFDKSGDTTFPVIIKSFAPSEARGTSHSQRPQAIVKIDLIYEAMPELII